jgi:outer membrane protein OmpA-like peptidoglycan-associated protein
MASKTSKRLQQLDRKNQSRSQQRSQPLTSRFTPTTVEDPAASWAAFVAGMVVLVLLVMVLAVLMGTSSIQSDIESRSEQALRIAGFQEITADADGFNVALKGQYREGQDIESGVQAVAALSGVDSVDATGVWEIEAPEAVASVVIGSPVVFAWSGDAVTVSGTISTEEQQDFVVTSLGALTVEDGTALRFSSVDVANVEILEGLEPEDDWIGTIIAFVGTLAAGLDEGSITVNPAGEVVTTAGEAETRQLKRDLTDASEDLVVALGAEGFDVTDGVLGPPKPPAPTKAEVEELERTLAELIEGKVVEFEFASDQLTPAGIALLDELLVPLVEFSAVPVEIAGHADAQGSPERNLELSRRRAQAVLDYFVSQGEDPERFVAVGYGDTRPIADNSTAEGRQKNRRIEFIALEE